MTVGKMNFKEVSKEELLNFWKGVARKAGLRIRYGERVDSIARNGVGFLVTTTKGTYPARAVLLAIGRRGTPRRLEVAGEEQSKVVYRLAAAKGHAETVALLLAKGSGKGLADRKGADALTRALRGCHSAAAKPLIDAGGANGGQRSHLQTAAVTCPGEVVAQMIAKGWAVDSIDSTGRTALR